MGSLPALNMPAGIQGGHPSAIVPAGNTKNIGKIILPKLEHRMPVVPKITAPEPRITPVKTTPHTSPPISSLPRVEIPPPVIHGPSSTSSANSHGQNESNARGLPTRGPPTPPRLNPPPKVPPRENRPPLKDYERGTGFFDLPPKTQDLVRRLNGEDNRLTKRISMPKVRQSMPKIEEIDTTPTIPEATKQVKETMKEKEATTNVFNITQAQVAPPRIYTGAGTSTKKGRGKGDVNVNILNNNVGGGSSRGRRASTGGSSGGGRRTKTRSLQVGGVRLVEPEENCEWRYNPDTGEYLQKCQCKNGKKCSKKMQKYPTRSRMSEGWDSGGGGGGMSRYNS